MSMISNSRVAARSPDDLNSLTCMLIDPQQISLRGGLVATLPGASGDYISTPDSVAASITSSLVLIAYVTPDDWTPAANKVIGGKWLSAGDQRSYTPLLETTGKLNFVTSADGTTTNVTSKSTIATGFTDGTGHWVMVIFDDVANTTNFKTSNDPANTDPLAVSWSALGDADVAHVTAGIFDSTALVEIGSSDNGGSRVFQGTVNRAVIISGTDPTAAAAVDMDPNDSTGVSTWPSSRTGETWTISGNVTIH